MNSSLPDGAVGSDSVTCFDKDNSLPPREQKTEYFEFSEDDTAEIHSRSASSSLASPISSSASHSDASVGSLSTQTTQQLPEENAVHPILPEQVRWFYKGDGDRKWTPFIGFDSLRIECAFREFNQGTAVSDPADPASCQEERRRVHVQGGLYEADVLNRTTHPIYWNNKGESAVITRGIWFIEGTWQPLEETYADQLEADYFEMFNGVKESDSTKANNSGVHHIKFKDFYIEWTGVDRVYMHSEATSSKLYRAVGTKLGLGRGTRLWRGYSIEASMDDKPPDISHLVFVIHGIGQKMDTGSIAKSCSDLRETCSKVTKYFPDLAAENKRAEFLPVEWRSSLKLDGDTVDSITPNKVRGLRTLLNASAMDILYYTSPLYRSEITRGLQNELNRLHAMFCERHPYFEASGGKVSIVAHSLGCVIVYDIVMGWNPVQLYDQYVNSVLQEEKAQTEEADAIVTELEGARKRVQQLESELMFLVKKHSPPTLTFHLENLFCLGSPLAVFLALRGIRPKGNGTQDHILPRKLCSRLYNIYHPSDPIAYRLEPLVLKHYSTLAPLLIHRHDQLEKPAYEDVPAEAYAAALSRPAPPPSTDRRASTHDTLDTDGASTADGQDRRELSISDISLEEPQVESKGRLSGVWARWGRRAPVEDTLSAELTPLRRDRDLLTSEHLTSQDEQDSSSSNGLDGICSSGSFEEPLEGDPPIDHTELEWRLDYQLREGKMESAYLATLTAHTAYWTNLDIGLFVLTQLFPDHGPR